MTVKFIHSEGFELKCDTCGKYERFYAGYKDAALELARKAGWMFRISYDETECLACNMRNLALKIENLEKEKGVK
jgi:hypothetical protein